MKILLKNKKIYYDYEIEQQREAGLVLFGHEVKSIKQKKCSIGETIIRVQEKNLLLINMFVGLYDKTSAQVLTGYETNRSRILLLHKKELAKIVAQTTKTGLTPFLLDIHLDRHHRIKATIGIGKQKRKVEKKQLLKEKDAQRQAQKDIKRLGL